MKETPRFDERAIIEETPTENERANETETPNERERFLFDSTRVTCYTDLGSTPWHVLAAE